jgi:hypothetical protein
LPCLDPLGDDERPEPVSNLDAAPDDRLGRFVSGHVGEQAAVELALTTVKGRGALSLNVWPLLLRLRGLFTGGTAKVATTAAVAMAVTATGVTIESALVDRSNRASVGEQSVPGGTSATQVSAVAVRTSETTTPATRGADPFRNGGPTRDAAVAGHVPGQPDATNAPIPDLPRIEPAAPPETAGVPEVPVVVDEKTLEPVLEPLPELPLPEVDLGVVTEVADDVVPDELPTVEETVLTEPVVVPHVPELPPLR